MAQISDVGSDVYGIENKVEKQLRSSALSINQNGVSQSRDDGLTVCKQSHFVNQGVPVKHKKVTYNVDKDNCFNRRPVLSSRVHPESDREPSDRNRHNCYSNKSSSEEDANSDRRRTSRRHKHQSGDKSTGRKKRRTGNYGTTTSYGVAEEPHYRNFASQNIVIVTVSRLHMMSTVVVDNVLTIVIMTLRVQATTLITTAMNVHRVLE